MANDSPLILCISLGRCDNGTEAVGCGPQEEFRACADVTITTSDGSADSTMNVMVDPEVYVPREDDTRYNEVDFDEKKQDYDAQLRDEVAVESVVIIVLVSLLVTLMFFGGLFFYYTRGKTYIEKYVKDGSMPSLNMPSMPKMPKKLNLSAMNWPLSNIQIKNLPMFMKKDSATSMAPGSNGSLSISAPTKVMTKTNIDISKRPLPARPPQPPPRVKRPSSSRAVATAAGIQRPTAPPPAVPSPAVATLEIGEPTSVTINGVTVQKNNEPGVLVPATPAMASEDIPDSMQSVPPPPPACPPPEED